MRTNERAPSTCWGITLRGPISPRIATDVHWPLPPKALSASNSEGPFNSAISESGRQLRGEFVPSRKRSKPTAIDSGAAIIQQKGASFLRLIPEETSQDDTLRLGLKIGSFGKLLANALSPAEQACVPFNCQYPKDTRAT